MTISKIRKATSIIFSFGFLFVVISVILFNFIPTDDLLNGWIPYIAGIIGAVLMFVCIVSGIIQLVMKKRYHTKA